MAPVPCTASSGRGARSRSARARSQRLSRLGRGDADTAQVVDVFSQIHVQDLDVAPAPEPRLEPGRVTLDRPGCELLLERQLSPDPLQDHPQIPVAEAVAEE